MSKGVPKNGLNKGWFIKGSKGALGNVRIKNLQGLFFNKWEVLSRTTKSKRGFWQWLCKCECGNLKEVESRMLLSGASGSCGCYRVEQLRKKNSGENNNLWRGGATPENHKIRGSVEMKQWREAVFKRDDYICQACGVRGGRLNADHVLRFADYPDLRLEVLNGRTLCEPCHRKTDTWGRKISNNNLIV